MELFRLLGTVVVNTQEANENIEETSEHATGLSETFGKAAEKIAGFCTKILASTGAAATALGGMAISASSEMESALDNFASSTNIATNELSKYEDTMKNIYADNYGESFEDIADSMAKIKQQMGDIGAEKLEEMTTDALLLRDTFEFEVNESTRAAKMLMDQFGISSKEAYNLIAQGAKNGLDKNGDLLDSINEYAVHYKQMGYSASQFFNSLKNGTEAGTFSVDKLGDAMKEFGIRVKDTSTTTLDAFDALGYGATDSEDAIQETKLEIEKLEKQLKYAKMEQAGFNEKTSELTRMKNADKIAQYSGELKGLQNKLKVLSEDTETSLGSIADLQARFAQGGEAAQEAIAEVLEALFAVENEVERNAIGVGLFGSMWEDLGADGIKALTEVEGGIDTATDALSEMADVRYDNLNSNLEGLKKKINTSVVVPLGQKLEPIAKRLIQTVEKEIPQIQKLAEKLGDVIVRGFEKLEPAIEWLIDDALPVLVDIIGFCIENFETLAGVIATVYGAIKTLTIIKSITTAVSGASGAFSAFNAILSANPIGAVVTSVGLLAGGIYLLSDSFETQEEKEERARQEMEEYIEKSGEAKRAAQERREEIDRLAEQELAETELTKDLWAELQTLVDENGKVLEGNEDRVTFITGQLSEALGTEISLVDGQIQKYQELQKEIDNTIKKKEASIYLSASEQKYQEAITNKDALEDEIYAEQKAVDKAWSKFEKVLAEYNARKSEISTITDAQERADAEYKFGEWVKKYYQPLADEYKKAMADLENDKELLESYNSDIAQYQNAYTLFAKGEYEATVEYLDKITDARITAAEIAKGLSVQQLEQLKEQVIQSGVEYENYRILLANCSEDEKEFYEGEVAKRKKRFDEDLQMYKDAGGQNADAISRAITSQMEAYDSEFKASGSAAVKAIEKGFEEEYIPFKSNWQNALNNTMAGFKFDSFTRVGEQMAEGIYSGMTNKYSASLAKDTTSKFVSGLVDETKKAAEIKSPSRRFAKEVGAYIPSGIAMGVEENEDDAIESVDNIVGLMTSGQDKKTGSITNVTTSDSSLVAGKLDQLIQLMSAFAQQRIYLNGDVLVGELAPAMNMELGQIGLMTERGQ